MSSVLAALPGAQAARRLRRLLADAGVGKDRMPEIVTPAALLEELYVPPRKIAGQMQSHFAWMQAVSTLREDARKDLAPKADGADGPMAWAGIAREAQRVRGTAAAERLTLAEVAQRCAGLPGVCNDTRWQALARLEGGYLEALAEAGLCDRDEARRNALEERRVRCRKDIYLIGAQDLNGLERAMLCGLESPVAAVIPAPEEERERFDETGSLRVDRWHDAPIVIPNDILRFVDGPTEEAHALLKDIAALGGRFAPEEVTIGIGDEAAAESLARRMAALGLPAFSPFGRPLSRVRPAALLAAVRDHLYVPSARTFASLARHPDLEPWLTARMEAETDLPLLTQLDRYHAECLPTRLPMGPEAQRVRESACPSRAKAAREGALAAHEAAEALLSPLRGKARPISAWAAPIAALLRDVYADTLIGSGPGGRQLARSLTGLQEILQGLKGLPLPLSPTVPGAEALAFVLGQAEAERLPSEPPSGAGVEMMGWLELALDDAPVLLLTGLQEGCVPAATGDDSLLPDSLRQTLGLADDRRREARDGLLLRQMIESRQGEDRHVRLIVPRRGADGEPRLPSRLLFACSAEEAARRVADRSKDTPAAPPLFTAGTARALSPPRPIPPDPPLAEMSVSAFADYLACPYRFYLRHVLRLEEQDDSQDEMDRLMFGNLLHTCLDAFANSEASQSGSVGAIRAYFRDQLAAQSRRRFGETPARAIQMQVRQAGRRLDAFAEWQAASVLDGWMIQPDLSEKELTATLAVNGRDFIIKGRPDRVDYHGEKGYRVIDYKTGDSGKGPEEKHRIKDPETNGWRWIGLQLPLYRRLLSANGIPGGQIAPGELGYVLLSSDLAPITDLDKNKRSGGTGFVPVAWAEADHDSARQCAQDVIRRVRAGEFWPPADPPPFPPARTAPGRADVYSGLCLDSCRDRRDWFGPAEEA